MKKIGKIIIFILTFSFLMLFVSPSSSKASEAPARYSLTEVSESTGFIKLTEGNAIKHVVSAFVFYKDKEYTYLASCFSAHQDDYKATFVINEKVIDIEYVGGTADVDLAVFKYKSEVYNVNPLKFDTGKLKEGQKIYSVSLLGYENEDRLILGVQEGYVAKTDMLFCHDSGYLYNCTPLFQLDMYVTSSSHGGVIINDYGYVVGMSTFKDPDGSELNHAIYSQELVHFTNRILNKEISKRGDLGINIAALEDISTETQESLGFNNHGRGTVITSVNGRASSAGLSINQLILEVNGATMNNTVDLIRAIYKYNSGAIVKVKVLKPSGQTKTCKVKL